jgi:hypothetical protein
MKEQLKPIGELKLAGAKKIEDCEWCFQFDEDDAQVFAWTDEVKDEEQDPKVIFTITNNENSYISFTHKNGKSFRIFARELSDEGKRLRGEQSLNKIKTTEDESTNKEA